MNDWLIDKASWGTTKTRNIHKVVYNFKWIAGAERVNPLTAKLLNWIFTHFKLCLADAIHSDAIHNFKWVKIIQIWQNGGHLFSNIADWCPIFSLICLKGGT